MALKDRYTISDIFAARRSSLLIVRNFARTIERNLRAHAKHAHQYGADDLADSFAAQAEGVRTVRKMLSAQARIYRPL